MSSDQILGCGCEWSYGSWAPCGRARDLEIEHCGAPNDPDMIECWCCENIVDPADYDFTEGLCRDCRMQDVAVRGYGH